MSNIHFSNVQLEKGFDYFVYIGELKNFGLNEFLQEALTRILNRPFKFIAVVPDVFEQYNYRNLMVINPRAEAFGDQCEARASCRISARDFMACVSSNPKVRNLIRQLLKRQGKVFLYLYESLPEMTLDEIPGVSILGPDKAVAARVNNKIYQYQNLPDSLPLVEFKVCSGVAALVKTADALFSQWTDGIFVTQAYSAAGLESMIAFNTEQIRSRFCKDQPYLISRYVPHKYDPTVLAVVAGEKDVFVAGVADQRIEGGNRFTGSTFPSVLPAETTARLREYTILAGQWLAREGFRGIYGCDYLVDDDGAIRFLEINARKQGTTLEFCCGLEQSLPAGTPLLPELEYYAVVGGALPAGMAARAVPSTGLHWGTYNYKLSDTVHTCNYIPQDTFEREAFRKVAQGELKKHFLILEHIGSDFVVARGSFIGRIVALGHDHESVNQGLEQGRRTIELTLDGFVKRPISALRGISNGCGVLQSTPHNSKYRKP